MTTLLIDIHTAEDGGHIIDIVAGTPRQHRRHATTLETMRDVLNLATAQAHELINETSGRIVDPEDLERIESDAYGNPRHVVHFLALGLEEYAHNKQTKRAGLELYRGKKYAGMFIVHGYGSKTQLAHELTRVFFPESTRA